MFDVPVVMGILNVTPDSFYASSRVVGDALLERAKDMLDAGAAILDLGACSTRPGSEPVSEKEELARLHSALDVLDKELPDAVVSVDTFRAEVVRRAVEQFGQIVVNDISAGEQDPTIVDVVAHYDLPYVAMHMRGTPQTMQGMTAYEKDITTEVCDYFARRCDELHAAGVRQIILDPGFGFAKTLEQNYQLLAGLNRLCEMGYPVLVGLSRKSMIYKALDTTPDNALAGTTALHWEALRQGATLLRVHDVREAVETIKLYEKYDKGI